MKMIKEKEINGKRVTMVLQDDETIEIMLDDKVISSSAKDTWENLRNEDWAQSALMKLETDKYLKKRDAMDRLSHMAEEVF